MPTSGFCIISDCGLFFSANGTWTENAEGARLFAPPLERYCDCLKAVEALCADCQPCSVGHITVGEMPGPEVEA